MCLLVKKVYSLNPTEGPNEEQANYILGAQANVWTEYMTSTEQVEYMILPRMAALAEVQWTVPSKKEYNNFLQRLDALAKFYDRDGLNYAKHVFTTPSDSQQAE